jgi:hypothetical protein
MKTFEEQLTLAKKVATLLGKEVQHILGNPIMHVVDDLVTYIENLTGKPVELVEPEKVQEPTVASPIVDQAPISFPVSQPVEEVKVDAQPSESNITPSASINSTETTADAAAADAADRPAVTDGGSAK